MHWVIAAPFITEGAEDGWLTRYVPREKHQFTLIAPPERVGEWHRRSNRITDSGDWKRIWRHGKRALDAARGGVITHFPQLAAVVGLQQRFSLRRFPMLAWSFNLGQVYRGPKRIVARMALAGVDRFVVHSRREIGQYSEWLNLGRERFEFVPIQRACMQVEQKEDRNAPFVLAMGSAARDYRTFFQAVHRLNLPAVVVAAPHAINGLEVPANVKVLTGLTRQECRELARKARVSVVPINNDETASGQVTVVEAMMLGRPLVATRCMGTEDYVSDGQTGVLVEPKSPEALADAIGRLWKDEARRVSLGAQAHVCAAANYSNEAVARELMRILDAISTARIPVSYRTA
jgi:glycosyltransferase involved in cell wall biosynthesis